MIENYATTYSVRSQAQRALWIWRFWFGAVVGFTGVLAFLMSASSPSPSVIGWLLYFSGVAAIVRQPRHGVYLVLFLSLIGDTYLFPWYPFIKNFSSHESLLFANDALIFSPLESYLVIALLAWLGHGWSARRLSIYRGTLFWPAMAFGAFVVFGLVYGLSRGGNSNVALWEARALFYIPLMLVLTANLIREKAHVSNLLWAIAVALFIEGVAGFAHVAFTLGWNLEGVQAITEHTAAVHLNTLFILTCAVWIYNGSLLKKVTLPLFVPAVLITYVATQRRAAIIALGLAAIFLIVVLYRENRKALFVMLPPTLLLVLAYLGAFWNVSSVMGVPAQAIKSVIAPDQLDPVNQASNLYRVLENINIQYTIHAAPLLGIGFGHAFYRIVDLPNISWFVWWEYIPHNSILWLWMKTGAAGFLSALILFGLALMRGGVLIHRLPAGELKVAVLVAATYIAMHLFFAYVDMGWDAQSGVYLGLALGLINAVPRIADRPACQVGDRRPTW
jgi:hypothetical protein